MKVLIACEESQTVCIAFRERGHEAYSCDILPCSGEHSEWHIQCDALLEAKRTTQIWTGFGSSENRNVIKEIPYYDKIISFQPCTDLSVSGARWFETKRLSGEQEQSIRFFFEIWKVSNCSENPIGILNGGLYIKKWFPNLYLEMKQYGFPFKPSQIIQPYQFGHGETKATCLWLKGLPLLKPTNIVEGREARIHKLPPSTDRAKLRSKTFTGIAKAMAEQWG